MNRFLSSISSRRIAESWAHGVGRFRLWIVVGWILVAVTARVLAPSWNDVAYDGDFDYLPATMSSVAGGKLLDDAFPGDRSRSQMVLLVGRESAGLSDNDELVGLDLLRRLYHRLSEVSWRRAIDQGYSGGAIQADQPWSRWIALTGEALDQSIDIDKRFYEKLGDRVPSSAATLDEPRMAIAYWDRALLLEQLGGDSDKIASDFEAALVILPEMESAATPLLDRDLTAWSNLLDLLSWDDAIIGQRLKTSGARLAVLQLSSELAATENIATIEAIDALFSRVQTYSGQFAEPGLQLLKTGSAAIGGETLIAARTAIQYTEAFTIVMILTILVIVYRAPLLVAVPMISIGVAVMTSTALVTWLTQASANQALLGLDLRVFTTSRIFVVVILFGAGTDYCLFLIARLREEAGLGGQWGECCSRALSGVSGALLGSALTTIIGLGMLWIAEFGKFHYTGPIIGLCLAVGLLVCMTFTPALLHLLGPKVFWPSKVETIDTDDKRSTIQRLSSSTGLGAGLWPWISLFITRRPVLLLVLGIGLLLIPALHGWQHENEVTYDLSRELGSEAASRRGLQLLQRHFEIGEINPVTVLILKPTAMDEKLLERETKALAKGLYSLPNVVAVRTADDPLGDFPPDRDMGLLSGDAWRRRALKSHRIAKEYFFSSRPDYQNRLARLDVVIDGDPFSLDTAVLVANIKSSLATKTTSVDSAWYGSQVLMTGTTPSIMDLREVTLRDNRRIKIAVVLAVFIVLLMVIRQVGLCMYLIATVLLSYYATLGLSMAWFRWMYGDEFVGLDWKLPLFLFVILVAVGQDYNVYLVARIIEEQKKLGWVIALRKAVSRTGGIITACGLVMAATFFSMTSSAWFPTLASWVGLGGGGDDIALRGIVELGFALGLGVLIDTFYVRTILVPSFVAILGRWNTRRAS